MSVFLSQIPCYGITSEMTEEGESLCRKARDVIRRFYPGKIGEKLLKDEKIRLVHHFDALPARVKAQADSSGFNQSARFDCEHDTVWVDASRAENPEFMPEITACAAFARYEEGDTQLSALMAKRPAYRELFESPRAEQRELELYEIVNRTLAVWEGLTPSDAPFYRKQMLFRIAVLGLTHCGIPHQELLTDKKANAWLKHRTPPRLLVFEELRFASALALLRVKAWAEGNDNGLSFVTENFPVRDFLAVPGIPGRNVARLSQAQFPAPEAFFGTKAVEKLREAGQFSPPALRGRDPVVHCLDIGAADFEADDITEASKPLAGFNVRPWALFKGDFLPAEEPAKKSLLAAVIGRFCAAELDEYADGTVIPRVSGRQTKAVLTGIAVAPRLDWAELTFEADSRKCAAGRNPTAFASLWCLQASMLRAKTPLSVELVLWAKSVRTSGPEAQLYPARPAGGGKASDAYVKAALAVTKVTPEGVLLGENYLRLLCQCREKASAAGEIEVIVRESLFTAPPEAGDRISVTGWLLAGEITLSGTVLPQVRSIPAPDGELQEKYAHPGVRRRLRLKGLAQDIVGLAVTAKVHSLRQKKLEAARLRRIAHRSPAALVLSGMIGRSLTEPGDGENLKACRNLARAVLCGVPQAAAYITLKSDMEIMLRGLLTDNVLERLFTLTRTPRAVMKMRIARRDYPAGSTSPQAQRDINLLTTAVSLGNTTLVHETARRFALGIGIAADKEKAADILHHDLATPDGMLEASAFLDFGTDIYAMSDKELIRRMKARCREDPSPRNLMVLALALTRGGRKADPHAVLLALKIIEYITDKTALTVLSEIKDYLEDELTPEEKAEFPTFDLKAALKLPHLPEVNFATLTMTVTDPSEGVAFTYAPFMKALAHERSDEQLTQYIEFMAQNAAPFDDPAVPVSQTAAETSPYELEQWVDAENTELAPPVARMIFVREKIPAPEKEKGLHGAIHAIYPFFGAGADVIFRPLRASQMPDGALGQVVGEMMSTAPQSGMVLVQAIDALWPVANAGYVPGDYRHGVVCGFAQDLGAGGDDQSRKMLRELDNFASALPGLHMIHGPILSVEENWAVIAGVAFARLTVRVEGDAPFESFPICTTMQLLEESRKTLAVNPGEELSAIVTLQLYLTDNADAFTLAKKTLH